MDQVERVSDETLDSLVKEFNAYRSDRGDVKVDAEFLIELAKKYDFTTGNKWMVMAFKGRLDSVWQALGRWAKDSIHMCPDNVSSYTYSVPRALLAGELPNCVISIKVNITDPRREASSLCKVNVFTRDFSSESDELAADSAIVECLDKAGFDVPREVRAMKYKVSLFTLQIVCNATSCIHDYLEADVFTHVDVFRGQDPVAGLIPSMYHAELGAR